MPIRDLGELLSPDRTSLIYNDIPWRRHEDPDDKTSPMIEGTSTYVVPSPDSTDGLRLTALVNLGFAAASGQQLSPEDLAALQLDDTEERNQYEQVLTKPVFDQMCADGVSWAALKIVAQDALITFGMSEDVANLTLELAKAGNQPARPNRATKRAAKKQSSKGSTPRRRAGSTSKTAGTATPDRTRSRTSTSSKNATRTTPEPEAKSA